MYDAIHLLVKMKSLLITVVSALRIVSKRSVVQSWPNSIGFTGNYFVRVW